QEGDQTRVLESVGKFLRLSEFRFIQPAGEEFSPPGRLFCFPVPYRAGGGFLRDLLPDRSKSASSFWSRHKPSAPRCFHPQRAGYCAFFALASLELVRISHAPRAFFSRWTPARVTGLSCKSSRPSPVWARKCSRPLSVMEFPASDRLFTFVGTFSFASRSSV